MMPHYIDRAPGRSIRLKGQEYLYFGGTSYLGMQNDVRFGQLLCKNITKYGVHHGASRNSNLRLSLYSLVERHLADLAGCEAALTLSSGFLAGQLAGHFFEQETYRSFIAPGAHAALFRGGQMAYANFESLAAAIQAELAGDNPKIPVLFTDSLDTTGSSFPDYPLLKQLPLESLILVADDSHGLGILGPRGGGCYARLAELPVKELLVCASLGKAMGIQAGVLFGTAKRLDALRQTSFFGGASPAAPAYLATLLASEAHYEEKRKRLQANIRLFETECLYANNFARLNGYPVYGYSNPGLTAHLEANKIVVTDFSYTTALTGRIVLGAQHRRADIRRLLTALHSFFG